MIAAKPNQFEVGRAEALSQSSMARPSLVELSAEERVPSRDSLEEQVRALDGSDRHIVEDQRIVSFLYLVGQISSWIMGL